jgi:RNA polymerase sigma-70 factor (ECF subfamily)
MTRHRQAIFRLAYGSVGEETAAQDITQEVFVRAWFALPRFKPQAKFSTWLHRIAINLCRDLARSAGRHQAEITTSLDCEEREHASPARTPAEEAQNREEIALLAQGIAGLPMKLREAFLMAVMEQHSHEECAQILEVTTKAVENRVRRARQMLERWLGSA